MSSPKARQEAMKMLLTRLRQEKFIVKRVEHEYDYGMRYQLEKELLVNGRLRCKVLVPEEVRENKNAVLYLRGKAPREHSIRNYDFLIIVANIDDEFFGIGYRELFCIPSEDFAAANYLDHYAISLWPTCMYERDRELKLDWEKYIGKRGMLKLKTADFQVSRKPLHDPRTRVLS